MPPLLQAEQASGPQPLLSVPVPASRWPLLSFLNFIDVRSKILEVKFLLTSKGLELDHSLCEYFWALLLPPYPEVMF